MIIEVLDKSQLQTLSKQERKKYFNEFKKKLEEDKEFRKKFIETSSSKYEDYPMGIRKRLLKEVRKYVRERKFTNLTKGAVKVAPKLKRVTAKICESVMKIMHKGIEFEVRGLENIPDEAVIFAHTHHALDDNLTIMVQLKSRDRHGVILHHEAVKAFFKAVQLNTGLILIKKDDKENKTNAKLDMIKALLMGKDIHYFPEGAWNRTEHLPHLNIAHGVMDLAKKSGSSVVPVVHDYEYDEKGKLKKITTIYCKPIMVSLKDKLEDKLEELSEGWASAYFYKWEETSECSREEDYQRLAQTHIKVQQTNANNLVLSGVNATEETRHLYKYTPELNANYPYNTRYNPRTLLPSQAKFPFYPYIESGQVIEYIDANLKVRQGYVVELLKPYYYMEATEKPEYMYAIKTFDGSLEVVPAEILIPLELEELDDKYAEYFKIIKHGYNTPNNIYVSNPISNIRYPKSAYILGNADTYISSNGSVIYRETSRKAKNRIKKAC